MDIYTDGACLRNPGPGGTGVLFIKNGKVFKEHSQGYKETTNNRMEYRACIEALEMALEMGEENVTLYTDSSYVKDSITEWAPKWEALGWYRNKTKTKDVKNKDLCIRLYNLNKELAVTWEWVKGHNGNVGNERADELASASAIDKANLIEDERADFAELEKEHSPQGSLF